MNTSATAVASEPLIVRLLKTLDRIDGDQIAAVWEMAVDDDQSIEDQVLRCGLADEHEIATAYADHYLMPLFDPPAEQPLPIDPRVSGLLTADLCREHHFVPLADDGATLDVALFSPDTLRMADEVKRLTGRQMRPMFAPRSVIDRLIDDLYQTTSDAVVTPAQRDRCLIPLVRHLIASAADELHLEPHDRAYRVRMRIDGQLRDVTPSGYVVDPVLVESLRSLVGDQDGRIDALTSQDDDRCRSGRLAMVVDDRPVDVMLSICRTIRGSRATLRCSDVTRLPMNLLSLGMTDPQLHALSDVLADPHGLILVCGPRFSGKTTTQYAILDHLNEPSLNVCSIERRVGAMLAGVSQSELDEDGEATYAKWIDHYCRQHADVLMVGEAVESQTVTRCLRAALSGHMILAGVATKQRLGGWQRLQTLSSEPRLVQDAVRLVINTRLVRRLCPHCRVAVRVDAPTATRLDVDRGQVIYRTGGCDRCDQTGYQGRIGVFELIDADQQTIGDRLWQAAVAKVIRGITSLEEVIAVIGTGGSIAG